MIEDVRGEPQLSGGEIDAVMMELEAAVKAQGRDWNLARRGLEDAFAAANLEYMSRPHLVDDDEWSRLGDDYDGEPGDPYLRAARSKAVIVFARWAWIFAMEHAGKIERVIKEVTGSPEPVRHDNVKPS